jgi:hypothetical protein
MNVFIYHRYVWLVDHRLFLRKNLVEEKFHIVDKRFVVKKISYLKYLSSFNLEDEKKTKRYFFCYISTFHSTCYYYSNIESRACIYLTDD